VWLSAGCEAFAADYARGLQRAGVPGISDSVILETLNPYTSHRVAWLVWIGALEVVLGVIVVVSAPRRSTGIHGRNGQQVRPESPESPT